MVDWNLLKETSKSNEGQKWKRTKGEKKRGRDERGQLQYIFFSSGCRSNETNFSFATFWTTIFPSLFHSIQNQRKLKYTFISKNANRIGKLFLWSFKTRFFHYMPWRVVKIYPFVLQNKFRKRNALTPFMYFTCQG